MCVDLALRSGRKSHILAPVDWSRSWDFIWSCVALLLVSILIIKSCSLKFSSLLSIFIKLITIATGLSAVCNYSTYAPQLLASHFNFSSLSTTVRLRSRTSYTQLSSCTAPSRSDANFWLSFEISKIFSWSRLLIGASLPSLRDDFVIK